MVVFAPYTRPHERAVVVKLDHAAATPMTVLSAGWLDEIAKDTEVPPWRHWFRAWANVRGRE